MAEHLKELVKNLSILKEVLQPMDCCNVRCEPDSACHLDDDPTLADCCRRDLQEQKYTQRIKEQLLSHDRTYERIEIANGAILRDEGAIRDAVQREEELDSLATDSDEDAGAITVVLPTPGIKHI